MITGIVIADAAADFARLQRRQTWSRLARRLHLRPDHGTELLAFDQFVGALGRTSQRELGLRTVDIDTIIGSVDRVGDFDRWFRPRPPVDRQRWIDLDRANRAGAIIPPIEVYRVGHLHFVRDGHHRVSIARAHGQRSIDAFVTEVTTTSRQHPVASTHPNTKQVAHPARRAAGCAKVDGAGGGPLCHSRPPNHAARWRLGMSGTLKGWLLPSGREAHATGRTRRQHLFVDAKALPC